MTNQACQADNLEAASTPKLRIWDLAARGIQHAGRYGIVATTAKVLQFCLPAKKSVLPQRAGTSFVEVLNLAPGEMVEVKTLDEIRATLDYQGKLRGLTFQPDMERFCGKPFRVFKRLETLYQEDKGRTRQVKATVLLEGVWCSGLLMRCDRSCFHFWREAWLRRVPKN